MMRLGPPGGPADAADALDAETSDLAVKMVTALAAQLHLEWCPSCQDFRELGHAADERNHRQAAVRANILEEQDYPTIG